MTKIEFSNDGQPAINDTNLNQMQDNIETAINAVAPDTGWQNLPLEQGITAYSSSDAYKPLYRKIGNIVYVVGCVKGVTSTNQVLAILPSGYRPISQMRYITGRSGSANIVLQLNTEGKIMFVNVTNGDTPSPTAYIYIQTSFVAD